MRILGVIIAASVILCVLHYVIIALVLLALCAILWGVFFRPAETFGFVAFLALLNFVTVQPYLGLGLIGLVLLLERWWRRRRNGPSSASDPPDLLLPP